jgi:peptidyl-prolyl cis-trans isomerase C
LDLPDISPRHRFHHPSKKDQQMTLRFRTSSVFAFALAGLAVAGCPSKKATPAAEQKTGPVVAHVGDDVITAEEFKKRLDETSPFLRARYNTIERKKEFLENLIRNELLAQEAQKRGLDKAPAVREQVKRAMIQELLKQQLDEKLTGNDISEDELKKFYDGHLDEFVKPERARVFRILLEAADAKAKTAAKKKAAELLKEIDSREKKGDTNAFQAVAMKESQDKLSAPMGGDLRFLSKDEMTKAYSAQLADAAFALKNPGDKSAVIETGVGIEIVKLQVKTVAVDRKFEESKDAIRGRMARERRSRDYDEFVKKLHEQGNVKIDDAELGKVAAAEAPAQLPPGGLPGQPMAQPQMAKPPAPPAPAAAPK